MENCNYISLGYPIGFLSRAKQDVYSIEINNNIMELRDKLSFLQWSSFLGGALYEKVKSQIIKEENISGELFDKVFEQLFKNKMIIKVSNDIEAVFDSIKTFKVIRQGMALDFDKKNNIYFVLLGQKVSLNPVEYGIWSMGNGMNSILEISEVYDYKNFNEKQKIQLIFSIMSLYNKGLIYIV